MTGARCVCDRLLSVNSEHRVSHVLAELINNTERVAT